MYEKARKLGIKTFCIHKGLAVIWFDEKYCRLHDLEPAALANPDLNFIIYHSGYPWVDDLANITRFKRNPALNVANNIYAELGSTFAMTVTGAPLEAAHVLGKLVTHVGSDRIMWGSDSTWWGSPQWQIDAFRRFQIPEDIQKGYRYQPPPHKDKELVPRLNAAPRRRGRAVAGVHGRPPTPARPQRRRRPQRACLRLRLRGVRRPRGASPPHRRIAVVDVRGLRGLAHAPLHRPPLECREPLERDGSPVREADAERGSGARAGRTRGRKAPSARRTRLRLSLFARPAVRVAHDVGTRSPSPGDCSVQRRSNPGLPVPSRLRGRFPGHRSNARATCRYLPPTGKDGPERTVPSAPGTEGPEALPPLPHGCEVGLPRRETFDFRQPPHAKCRKGESHRCTSYTATA